MGLGRAGGSGARRPGLHVSRIDGSPMVFNERDPWLPDLLICRPEFAEPALEALARTPVRPGAESSPMIRNRHRLPRTIRT